MTPCRHIAPKAWMTTPEIRAVFAALAAGGGMSLLVGGCVRDGLLGRPVKDVDIATDLTPTQVMDCLQKASIKSVPTGLAHGTVSAVIDGAQMEITTLRVDVKTDGRHAEVAFTDDWEADAQRRDFTLNALYCGLDGALYDPVGGLADLEKGRVRFVGEAVRRCQEDVLRVLRFFRFHAHYGRGQPDASALAACEAFAEHLPGLAKERLREELLRILSAPAPAAVFELMRRHGVLAPILPDARSFSRLGRLARLESKLDGQDQIAPSALRRLAALLPSDPSVAEKVAHRLRLSNRHGERLAAAAFSFPEQGPRLEQEALRSLIYHHGAETVRDRALLAWSAMTEAEARADAERWRGLLKTVADWVPPDFPLTGKDVLALGVPSGPDLGCLLEEVRRWWEDQDFTPQRDACLEKLQRLVKKT